MPLYEFECPEGHVTGKVYRMNDERPATVKCERCPKRARRMFTPSTVVDDFPEHFNISLGEVVKNRAHLKQIQKERGLKDYDPVPGTAGYELVRDRLRRGA